MTHHRFPVAGQFKKAFEDARENNANPELGRPSVTLIIPVGYLC